MSTIEYETDYKLCCNWTKRKTSKDLLFPVSGIAKVVRSDDDDTVFTIPEYRRVSAFTLSLLIVFLISTSCTIVVNKNTSL